MLYPEYIKDMKNSYLLLKSMEGSTLGYASKMLINNKIPGLLKVEIRCFDELNVYYYDISGKKNLLDYYEKASLKTEDIKHIVTSVINTLEGSLEYLLHENDFILDPGYVHIDPITNEIALCHLVGFEVNAQTQISSFIEYLMNKVDYKDEKAVLLVYSLYKESRELNCTYGKLLSEINKKDTSDKEVKSDCKELQQISTNTYESTEVVMKSEEKTNHQVALKKGKGLKNLVLNRVSVKEESLKKSIDSNYKHLLPETIGEEESMCYSKKTYVIATLSMVSGIVLFIIAFLLKLMHNTFKTELDPIKMVCYLLILASIEIYIMFQLFQEGNKITRMVSTIRYDNNKLGTNGFYENKSGLQCNKEDSKNTLVDINKHSEVLEDNDMTVKLYEEKEEEMVSDETEALFYFESKLLLKPLDKDNYKYINLSKFPYLIGKNQKAVNHCLESNTISRLHSRFEKKEDDIYLLDMNSLNGTFVNGDRLPPNQPYRISSGDKISFAHLNYIYQVE